MSDKRIPDKPSNDASLTVKATIVFYFGTLSSTLL
jgi:hypothetical protein